MKNQSESGGEFIKINPKDIHNHGWQAFCENLYPHGFSCENHENAIHLAYLAGMTMGYKATDYICHFLPVNDQKTALGLFQNGIIEATRSELDQREKIRDEQDGVPDEEQTQHPKIKLADTPPSGVSLN